MDGSVDRWQLSLYSRIGLVLTALAAALVLALGGLWLKQTRDSIREEVEAASRVAEQWLGVTAAEARVAPPTVGPALLLARLRAVGRIRANALEVVGRDGLSYYVSPPSTYKAGRAAPVWFAAIIEPELASRRIDAGALTLLLRPDASRASLDAWDELLAMAGWTNALLVALFFATRFALDRALRPVGQVMAALDRTGHGRFDTRLPVFPVPELGRLARAFNGMADRLAQAVNENVRLENDRELAERLQQGLEAERRAIARELHDELAQSITAVRALAGAIAQRTGEQAELQRTAESIVAVTGQMQDGVRTILHRLRPRAEHAQIGLEDALRRYLAVWQQHYPGIALTATLAAGPAPVGVDLALAVLRIVQEGLTNVVRHAGASCVELSLRRLGVGDDEWLEVSLGDDGRGLTARSSAAGCGFGLSGMRERVAALAGELRFASVDGHGTRLCARLPTNQHKPMEVRS